MIISPIKTRTNGLGADAQSIAMPISATSNSVDQTQISSFVQKLSNMPDALKQAIAGKASVVSDRMVYAVHVNKVGNILKILGADSVKKDALCNLDKGKLLSNEYFYFSKIRFTGKLFTLDSGATEVSEKQIANAVFGEVTPFIKSSFLNIRIGNNVMVDELPLRVLSTTEQEKSVGVLAGTYNFGNGFLVQPNDTLEVSIKTPEGFTLEDPKYAIQLEIQGIGVKLVTQ